MQLVVRPPRADESSARAHRADLIAFVGALGLIAAVAVVGYELNQAGVPLYAATAPLFGLWSPRVGVGTPLALVTAAAVIAYGPTLAAALSWRRVLVGGYLGAVLWTFALAMVDGWRGGIAGRLVDHTEYLADVPRVTDISATIRDFTAHILAFQPGSWTVHVSGHPPGALLFYVGLDRLGLGGGAWAGIASILIGSLAAVAVPITVRVLAGEDAARATVPLAVLFPGAVWVGVSADGVFAGVVATGVALVAIASVRRSECPVRAILSHQRDTHFTVWREIRADLAAVAGGILLGCGVFLNYGLVLMASLVVAVGLARGRLRPILFAAAGAAVVVGAFAAAGFWWLDGYHLVIQRYYQGEYAQRPYSYWVWGNLGAVLLSAGAVAAVVLRRAVATGADLLASAKSRALRTPFAGPVAVAALVLAATCAVLAADLSGLSKAEVERIWLPFAVWFAAGAALLPARHRRGWLVVQALTALAVNHLLVTNW